MSVQRVAEQSKDLMRVYDKGAWVVATPDGVWHKDSHQKRKFISGGTQDTDFDQKIIGRILTKFLRRRNRGGHRGTQTP